MSATIENLASYFFQVAYVVPDLEKSIDFFKKHFGVPHFVTMPTVTLGPPHCLYRGKPIESSMDIALGYMKDTQIELICPHTGPSLYTEFVEKKGHGLHHIAFLVPDFEGTKAALAASGLEVIAEGRLANNMTVDFVYFDCDFMGASVVELLGMDAAARAVMEQIKKGPAGS